MNNQTQKSNLKMMGVSPDPALQFVFAMFAIITWLSSIRTLTPDVQLSAAFLQISLGVCAYTGGHMNLRRGDPHGNINLVLAVILGFASGLTRLASVAAALAGWSFHPWILSVALLLGGLYMLAFVPLLRHGPLYILIEHMCVSLGLILQAGADLLGMPVLRIVSAWLLFAFAWLALFQGVSIMYAQYGHKLRQGSDA